MIRRGRKAKGGIKKGSKGGEFTITASGKKSYISKGPSKVPAAAAVKKPHKEGWANVRRKAGTALALGTLAASGPTGIAGAGLALGALAVMDHVGHKKFGIAPSKPLKNGKRDWSRQRIK